MSFENLCFEKHWFLFVAFEVREKSVFMQMLYFSNALILTSLFEMDSSFAIKVQNFLKNKRIPFTAKKERVWRKSRFHAVVSNSEDKSDVPNHK